MRLQKINKQQSFGMACKVDYTGMTPAERAAWETRKNALNDVEGTVCVARMVHVPGGKWYYPATYANRLEGKDGHKAYFAFELPKSWFERIRHCMRVDVISKSTTGLSETAIGDAFDEAISEVKTLCRTHKATRGVKSRIFGYCMEFLSKNFARVIS